MKKKTQKGSLYGTFSPRPLILWLLPVALSQLNSWAKKTTELSVRFDYCKLRTKQIHYFSYVALKILLHVLLFLFLGQIPGVLVVFWWQMGVLFSPRIRKGLKAESCRTWSPQQRLVVSKVELWYRFRVKEGFLFQSKNHRVTKSEICKYNFKMRWKLGNQRKRSIAPLYIIYSRFLGNLTLLTPRNTFCACHKSKSDNSLKQMGVSFNPRNRKCLNRNFGSSGV